MEHSNDHSVLVLLWLFSTSQSSSVGHSKMYQICVCQLDYK